MPGGRRNTLSQRLSNGARNLKASQAETLKPERWKTRRGEEQDRRGWNNTWPRVDKSCTFSTLTQVCFIHLSRGPEQDPVGVPMAHRCATCSDKLLSLHYLNLCRSFTLERYPLSKSKPRPTMCIPLKLNVIRQNTSFPFAWQWSYQSTVLKYRKYRECIFIYTSVDPQWCAQALRRWQLMKHKRYCLWGVSSLARSMKQ